MYVSERERKIRISSEKKTKKNGIFGETDIFYFGLLTDIEL